MLLETVDVRRNDVLIYSGNVFDLNNNFRIVFKKDKIKRPYKISFDEVCDFIVEPTAKNIIVYRLLTNVSSLDVFSTKYGYFIKSQNGLELIYFDPIFAIKDLPNLNINLSDKGFRFKIQQVGYTSLTGRSSSSDFKEMFSWDMRAKEAQNQNDKVFADALFVFDENYVNDGKDFTIDEREKVNRGSNAVSFSGNLREEINNEIIENVIQKPNVVNLVEGSDLKELKKEMLKKALGINTTLTQDKKQKSFSTFLERYRNEVSTEVETDEKSGLTGFFNENANKKLRDETVVLRFTEERY